MHLNIYGGLENKLELDHFLNFISNYDIILLSECWISEKSKIFLKGYDCFKKIRTMKKRSKRPSGGLVCFVKSNLSRGFSEINFDFEDGLCLRLDAKYFGWKNDIFIIYVYFKGENSPRNDMNDGLSPFDILLDLISRVSSDAPGILLAGDFNAHCGNTNVNEFVFIDESPSDQSVFSYYDFDDIVDHDIFTLNELNKFDIAVARKSKHKKVNAYGNKLKDLCQTCGLVFLNGRYKEDEGNFTFFNHIGQAINDYIICNKNSLQYVSSFKVFDQNIWSDHCVLSCEIKCNVSENNSQRQNTQTPILSSKWNGSRTKKKHINLILIVIF